MPVYLAIASTKPQDLEKIIDDKIEKSERLKVDAKTWLICPPSSIVTPKELCDFLGVSSGIGGQVIITSIGSYYGYHSKEVWSWLSSKGA